MILTQFFCGFKGGFKKNCSKTVLVSMGQSVLRKKFYVATVL